MGGFIYLVNESYELIKSLNRKKLITQEAYNLLEECQSIKQLNIIINTHLSIKPQDEDKIWRYIRKKVWKWNPNKQRESTIFNEWQSIFTEKILEHNGIYYRDTCQKEILNDFQISRQIRTLEDWEIVIALHLNREYGSKTIFIIHPKIKEEIKNEH